MKDDCQHENILKILQQIDSIHDIIIETDAVVTILAETPVKLFNYCHSLIPNIGRRQLRHFFKKHDCIFLNGNAMGKENETILLRPGDRVKITLRASHFLSEMSLYESLKIHFQSQQLVVIEKPTGVVSDEGSLFEFVFRAKLWEGSKFRTCFPLFRIEERLSGLMIVFCDTAAFIQASHLLKDAFIVMSCMIVSLSNSSDTFLNSNFGLLRSLKVEHLSTTETRSFGKISECRVIPVIDSIDIKNEDEALLFSRKLSIDMKRVKSVLKANGFMIVGLNDVGVKQKGIFAVWNEVNLACLIGLEKIITIPVSEKFLRLSKKESEFLEKKKQKDLMLLENIAGDDEIEQADHENGKPIEYIVHRALFFGLRFYVDESVLIPRRSSEALVTYAIDYCKEFPSETSWNILDLGTGSGCLLLSVLSSLCGYADPTTVSGRGIDVSEAAISIAQMNCQEMNLSSFAHFEIGDITKPEDWMSNNAQLPLNMILCNPPYSSRHERNRLSIQSKRHEPAMALFADDYDSLKMYRKLFEVLSSFEERSSCENLFEENRSIFILEVGSGQLESVLSIFSPLRCWKFKDIRKDYKGMNRCVILQYQSPSS